MILLGKSVLKFFKRHFTLSNQMANSKFEYVRQFELDDKCIPNCWIVARLDGRNFHKFADDHKFEKPNDKAALDLMCASAISVMEDFNDVIVAYGQSDEFSFVFRKETDLFQRRSSKLLSTLVSLFSSSYTFNWNQYFISTPLLYPPSFDARIVLYPSLKNIRDYLSWRQADCHINNLHNTCFWKLVNESKIKPSDAQKQLEKMLASDKNELLFSQYNLNYNNVEQIYRKGSVIVRERVEKDALKDNKNESLSKAQGDETSQSKKKKKHKKRKEDKFTSRVFLYHTDIIGDTFWKERPHLLTE